METQDNNETNDLFIMIPPQCVGAWSLNGDFLKIDRYRRPISSFGWGHAAQWVAALFKLIYQNFGNANFVQPDVLDGAGVTVTRLYGGLSIGLFADFVGRWINGRYGTTPPNQPQINAALQKYAFDKMPHEAGAKITRSDKMRVAVMRAEMEAGRRLTNSEAESLARPKPTNVAEIIARAEETKNPFRGFKGENPINAAYFRKLAGRASWLDYFLLFFEAPGTLAEETPIKLANEWERCKDWPKRWAEYYKTILSMLNKPKKAETPAVGNDIAGENENKPI